MLGNILGAAVVSVGFLHMAFDETWFNSQGRKGSVQRAQMSMLLAMSILKPM